VSSTLDTVAAMVQAAKLYPELKNSSDKHLVALRNFPSSISPTSLAYLRDTILDRVYVSRPQHL